MFPYLLSWRCCCLETTHTQRVPLRGRLFAWFFFFLSLSWGALLSESRAISPSSGESFCLFRHSCQSQTLSHKGWSAYFHCLIVECIMSQKQASQKLIVFQFSIEMWFFFSFIRYATHAYGQTSTFPYASWNLVDRKPIVEKRLQAVGAVLYSVAR